MNEITTFEQQYPIVASRGIDESTWLALKQTVFPGAKDESVLMAIDYCKARDLDILMKPVHIVPMYVDGAMRDTVMPGIGLYRIQAARSGDFAGSDEPVFGPDVQCDLGSAKGFTYPEWCKVTVSKLIGDRVVDFTAKEYFLECYASKKKADRTPNAMWFKRPRGQLAKVAESAALRKGWPEIASTPTFEEMEGRQEIDVTPLTQVDRGSILNEAAGIKTQAQDTPTQTEVSPGEQTALSAWRQTIMAASSLPMLDSMVEDIQRDNELSDQDLDIVRQVFAKKREELTSDQTNQ